jgi:hypothetical protein
MAILVKYKEGLSALIRSSRLEKRIKALGQPTAINKGTHYDLMWIYNAKIGINKYEQRILNEELKIQDTRDIVEFELLG